MRIKKSLEERIENAYINLSKGILENIERYYKYSLKTEFILDEISFDKIEKYISEEMNKSNRDKSKTFLTVGDNLSLVIEDNSSNVIQYMKDNLDKLKEEYLITKSNYSNIAD